jgi:hypothetical protein
LALFDDAGVSVGIAATRSRADRSAAVVAHPVAEARYRLLVVATRPAGAAYRLTVATRP